MNGPRRVGESLLALVIVAGFITAAQFGHFGVLEHLVYSSLQLGRDAPPRDDIVVVAIDESSLERLGAWPWRRSVVAELIDRVARGRPKVIATTLSFEQPESDPALDMLQRVTNTLARTLGGDDLSGNGTRVELARNQQGTPGARSDAGFLAAEGPEIAPAERRQIGYEIGRLRALLDGDRRLAQALDSAGNVVIGLRSGPDKDPTQSTRTLPSFVAAHVLRPTWPDAESPRLEPTDLRAPIAVLGREARDLGVLPPDRPEGAGALRLLESTPYGLLPSVPLLLAARGLGLETRDIELPRPDQVRLGEQVMRTDSRFRVWTTTPRTATAIDQDSAEGLLTGSLTSTRYRDRIVLIGPTAAGLVTEGGHTPDALPPVIALAQMTAALLDGRTVFRPDWARWVEAGIGALIGLYLVLAVPRVPTRVALAFSAALLLALVAAQVATVLGAGVWIQMAAVLLMLLSGHLLLVAARGLSNGHEPAPAATTRPQTGNETLRAQELARRRIAQLDQSFERLQRVPLDDAVIEELYELGLAYERERMPRKALAVFRYLAAYNPRLRDLKERIRKINTGSTYLDDPSERGDGESAVGGVTGSPRTSMLGRYRIERELGQGAMGKVYLGTDSKIGRTVAIKTMALVDEFDEDDLQSIKERFFREAETAGRLSHPNIVTIYDVGEEHALAYIAMEYLGGRNLGAFTRADRLLPLDEVLEIIAKCAETLAFAHSRNVVHRDIKPANVMFEPVTGALKITDFGIARITDSSKTKRGMVLGTPSYMSPEQLAGQRVDGRSDLFSLGVMLYQMTTGQLPFRSDSMASLMFKIANEAHPPLRALRTDAPPCLQAIVDRALGKTIASRYQSGTQMAQDLRECRKKITM
jgi:serine/threonine-protein kinase